MPECIVCGSEDFDLLDGLFFCTDCGTQSQVLQCIVERSYLVSQSKIPASIMQILNTPAA